MVVSNKPLSKFVTDMNPIPSVILKSVLFEEFLPSYTSTFPPSCFAIYSARLVMNFYNRSDAAIFPKLNDIFDGP